jgi:uncharacterized membrane protein YdbT with pleckstrin-like domain
VAAVAYPDEVLVEGERVVLHRNPHWRVLLGPVAAFLVTAGAAGYLAAALGGPTWWPVLVGVAVLLVLWLTVLPVVRWRTTHLVVTDRRVLLREGVLSRQDVDVPLHRVTGVGIRRSVPGRVLGYGTLVIDTEAGGALEFPDVPDAERVQAALQQSAGL